jgi:hypothetical protein
MLRCDRARVMEVRADVRQDEPFAGECVVNPVRHERVSIGLYPFRLVKKQSSSRLGRVGWRGHRPLPSRSIRNVRGRSLSRIRRSGSFSEAERPFFLAQLFYSFCHAPSYYLSSTRRSLRTALSGSRIDGVQKRLARPDELERLFRRKRSVYPMLFPACALTLPLTLMPSLP